jgi:uncharacterized membrane protein
MDQGCLAALGVLLGLIVFVVCPILSLYVFFNYRRRIQKLEAQILDLGRRVATISGATAFRKAEAASPKIVPPAAAVPAPPTLPVSAPPAPSLAVPRPPEPAEVPASAPPRVPVVPVLSRRPAPVPARIQPLPRINWENFLGVKLFAWIGGLVAFLAAVFFLKYSFDNNLISPPFRVAIGLLVGLVAVFGGLKLPRERYSVLGQSLCATGILILYGSLFGAHALYKLIPSMPTFGCMALVTAAAFLLAIRLNAPVVAVLGLLGGFLTPPLLSTGVDNPFGLFSYLALLDAGLVAVVLVRRWTYLLPLAALGTVAMQAGWVDKFFESPKVLTAFGVFDGFAFLFSGAFLVAQRRKIVDRWTSTATLTPVAAALIFALYIIAYPYPEIALRPGLLFTFVFLADLALLAPVWVHPPLRPALPVAGLLAFALLGAWTSNFLNGSLLYWNLAFVLLFAVLHGVLPAVLQRLKPQGAAPAWLHLFPALALLLLLGPLFKLPGTPIALWICVLLIDGVAFLLTLLTGSIVGLVAVLILTLVTIGASIFQVPAALSGTPVELWLIAGFGALFFFAGTWAAKKILGSQTAPAPEKQKKLWTATFPALSAVLPFMLLILVVARLRLPDPSTVFGLATFMLVLAFFAVARYDVDVVGAASAVALFVLELVWHGGHFRPEHASVALIWYGGFLALLFGFPFVFRKRLESRTLPWTVAALAGPGQFYLVYQTVKAAHPNELMGLLPAAFVLPYLGGTAFLARSLPADGKARLAILSWFGGIALFFITLVFPIQFSKQWLTVGWAIEGAALLWLWRRLPHEGLRIAGAGLLIAAFVRLALNPAVMSEYGREKTPIFNWILYTYGLVAASLFAGAKLIDPKKPRILNVPAKPVLKTLGGIMLFLLMNMEIADFYSGSEQYVTFHFSGNLAQDMTYSIAWALFSLGVLVGGIRTASAGARWTGLVLLILTLSKLFLHDLWSLGGLYRIFSLIGLAAVLLTVSFIYQRYLVPRKPPLPEPPKTSEELAP